MAKTVIGRERSWQIGEALGSGDAGEVLRVFSQSGNLQGVMKRPAQNVSGGTIVRQAGQIETEGKILTALDGVDFSKNGLTIHTPLLLDSSIEGTARTVNLFIVSEEVPGKSISALLAEQLTNGQPIPQNLVLKVLSSLLLLLERVHSKGVVWNDVKMDHIYWSPEFKTMSFIDWGNGTFFQPQPDPENSPIWQDYTQFIEEGLILLEQTAPNLIHDLGWPLHASEFKPEDIPQLRMRLEYLESYLSMRAIEYELLFERFTNSLTELEALSQALDLNQELQQFGIHTDLTLLRSAAQELLFSMLESKDFEQADKMFTLVENSLKEKMSIQWQLGSYLFKLREKVPTEKLNDLLEDVFAQNWIDAVWKSRELIGKGFVTKELASAVYAMRNLHLGSTAAPTIYSDLISLSAQLEKQLAALKPYSAGATALPGQLDALHKKVQTLAANWSTLATGEPLGNQLFNLRQVIGEANALRIKLPAGLSERLQRALTTAREIYQGWIGGDIASSLNALKTLYLNEPTLDYLLPLAEHLSAMKTRLEQFESGPPPNQSVNVFAAELLSHADDLSGHLGKAEWLQHYNHALQHMSRAVNLENLQDAANQHAWPTPWVFQPGLKLERSLDQLSQAALTDQQKQSLSGFHQSLRSSQPSAASLLELRRLLPASYRSYKELQEEFEFLFSPITREAYHPDLQGFASEDSFAINQALRTLDDINKWKAAAETGDWHLFNSLTSQLDPNWTLSTTITSATNLWTNEVLPALTELKQRNWKSTRYKQRLKPLLPALAECQSHLYTFICEWQKIEVQGLYPELLNELVYQCDAAQATFFDAWQSLARSDSSTLAWLAQNQQSIFSEINQTLLTLLRSLRAMQRNFEVINQPEMARTRLAGNAAGDLMYLLVKVDETANPPQKLSQVFKRWQRQYLDLLSMAESNKIRQGIREVENIHPLLPWFDELVRRDSGYFELPPS